MSKEPLVLTDEMKQVMIDAAKEAHPNEACGIVAGGVCYRLPNKAEHPERTFRISAEDIADVATHHRGYSGIWHSHPSGNPHPSETDWVGHPISKALIVVAGETVTIHYADDTEA